MIRSVLLFMVVLTLCTFTASGQDVEIDLRSRELTSAFGDTLPQPVPIIFKRIQIKDYQRGRIAITFNFTTYTITKDSLIVSEYGKPDQGSTYHPHKPIKINLFDVKHPHDFSNYEKRFIIHAGNLSARNMKVWGTSSNFSDSYFTLDSCKVEKLDIEEGNGEIYLSRSEINEFKIRAWYDVELDGVLNQIGNLTIEDCKIRKIRIQNCETIVFRDFHSGGATVFLEKINLDESSTFGVRAKIGLSPTINFKKLIFNSENFELDRHLTNLSINQAITITKWIKDKQDSSHYERGLELVDKDLKHLTYINAKTYVGAILGLMQDRIAKYWWDYGYDKGLVVSNSIVHMVIFFWINLFFYNELLDTYNLAVFEEARKDINSISVSRHFNVTFFYCLYFTGTIFWGIKLDVDKISLKNMWLVSLIILEYIAGIICLAYLANYIIID